MKESQRKLQDAQVELDLQVIYKNYKELFEALKRLYNSSLSLVH